VKMGHKMTACGYWKRKNNLQGLIKFFAVQNWGGGLDIV